MLTTGCPDDGGGTLPIGDVASPDAGVGDAGVDVGECPEGFEFDSSGVNCVASECDDAAHDACMSDEGGECSVREGSFVCSECPEGYALSEDAQSCENIDECADAAEDVCSGGSCTDSDGSYLCTSCPDGAQVSADGLACESDGTCPEGSAGHSACMLEDGGVCTAMEDGYRCTFCPAGYALADDEESCVDVDECAAGGAGALACGDGGTCVNSDGGYACTECAAGFAISEDTTSCDDIDECADGAAGAVACRVASGGACTNNDGAFACESCGDGYAVASEGLTCEDVDECADGAAGATACQVSSGGSCTNSDGAYACGSCAAGYSVSGDAATCEDVDECADGAMGAVACRVPSGGSCTNTDGSYACASCGDGYAVASSGLLCEDIDECADGAAGAAACMVADGGTCADAEGSFSCSSCPDGFVLFPDGRGCELPPTCGDGSRTGSEVCDDGNRVGGDGCRADCTGTETCGDGLVDTPAAEQCDDGNDVDGDGCDSFCQLPPAVTTPPTEINVLDGATLSCSLSNSNTGRKATADQLGRLYAVLNCDGAAVVTSSVDGGFNWRAPFATGLTDVLEVAIEGAGGGVAYVAAVTSNGLEFVETRDSGETWTVPELLGPATDREVSIDSYEEDIFIAVSEGSDMAIYRSVGAGATNFIKTVITQSNAFHEIMVDPSTGNVLCATDTPDFHLRLSEDHGVTYGAETNPSGLAYFSDWTLTNGTVFVSGTNESPGNLDAFELSDLSTSTVIGDLPNMGSFVQSRAIDSNALGDVFVVSNLDDSTIQLDRLVAGASAFVPAELRTLPSGSSPAVAALPSNDGVVVLYDDGTNVWATVQAY